MRNIIIYLFLFLPAVLTAQQIQTDKDTLRIFGSDSLFVTNTGDNVLILDSLYTVNPLYGYWMDVYTPDSSFTYYAGYNGYPGWGPLGLHLGSNQTAKFVFNYVDLCVVCKKNSVSQYFRDTLVFVSNSIQNDTTLIFVEGDGYPSSITGDENVNDSYFRLGQNYPNPFNPETKFIYSLAIDAAVSIKVYDVNGNEVATLVNEFKSAGFYHVKFNGERLPSGVYLYRMEADDVVRMRKMILLK